MRLHSVQAVQEYRPKPMSELAAYLLAIASPYVGSLNLNIGCGEAGIIPLPGWTNLDRTPGSDTECVCNLDDPGPTLSKIFPYPIMGCVLASHVLEHITNLIPLMREIHRVLLPGGYLIAITPHAGSDDAWEDPTHVRAFTQNSWSYFDRRFYQGQTGHGAYRSPIDFCFDVVRVDMVLQKRAGIPTEPVFDSALRELAARERNVIGEVIAILRKVEE